MTDDSRPQVDFRGLVAEMVEHLGTAGVTPGLEVGTRAPRFVLPDAHSGKVSLDDRLAEGPVVLSFYRGAWCPVCNVELRGLQEALPDIRARDASLIAISPQSPDTSAAFVERLELGFDVLSDVDQGVIRAYRLQFELPEPLRPFYERMDMDLSQHNADGTWHLPVPATFVLDTDGVVRARHVDPNYRERMQASTIIEALDDLAG